MRFIQPQLTRPSRGQTRVAELLLDPPLVGPVLERESSSAVANEMTWPRLAKVGHLREATNHLQQSVQGQRPLRSHYDYAFMDGLWL